MQELIASPYLDQHMVVKSGESPGLLLPTASYDELRVRQPPARPARRGCSTPSAAVGGCASTTGAS